LAVLLLLVLELALGEASGELTSCAGGVEFQWWWD
jgi:hypothetical protein